MSPAGDYTASGSPESLRLGEWRALGARVKAGHSAQLLARAGLSPASVVEIGCGDGALLAELSARGLARSLDGFEVAVEAVEIARSRRLPRVGRVEAYDGVRLPVADDTYDLAVCSHVLEHVEQPLAVLREAARVAEWLLLEVPLEANRSARRPAKRAEAARIGHVQFFDRAAIAALLTGAGWTPVHDLADPLPREHHTFFAPGTASTLKWAVRAATHRIAPRTAERLFTVHYAVLARRGSPR